MTTFISTAIPFVNARPHLGFAYELVLADVLARHHRRRGRAVHFVTGTDDNSLKNVVAARDAGITPRALVDRNAAAFAELCPLLDVAPDDFLRTSTDPRHRPTVEWLWRACAGDLYRRRWTGRYCAGCEAFVDDDIVICPEHHVAPETVSEENWFFRLSRYREPLREAVTSGRLAIVPESARAETLAFLAGEVRDLSVSRIASRSDGWGIPVPDDPSQVIYVWFDALANYLSSIGEGGWRTADRTHVIGKGITRFHAVYWPAFLLAAGLPLPDRLFVHGYLTGDGVKLSKSSHAGPIDPVVARCGADALRWFYLRRCRTRTDSDVSIRAICDAHDGDLADRLGNLVQRCITLAVKLGDVPASDDASALHALAAALPSRIDTALAAFAPDEATAAVIELLDAANRHLEVTAPWRLARTDPAAAARALHAPLAVARIAAAELAPFVPGIARTIAARLALPLVAGPPPIPRIGVAR